VSSVIGRFDIRVYPTVTVQMREYVGSSSYQGIFIRDHPGTMGITRDHSGTPEKMRDHPPIRGFV
jgi:hypothetical protein